MKSDAQKVRCIDPLINYAYTTMRTSFSRTKIIENSAYLAKWYCMYFVYILFVSAGLKQSILDLLLSFNPLWLRIGLEVGYFN